MKHLGGAFRRALGHPGPIVAFFCLRTVFAAAGALLWLEAFAPKWVMALPRKDASLFQPGLLLPVRLFAENREQWTERARISLWLAFAFIVAGAVVTAFALHDMNRAERSRSPHQALPTPHAIARQVMVASVSWVVVVLAVYVAMHLARVLPPLSYQFFGEKGADAALAAVAILLVTTIVLVRIACDLTRARLSHSNQPVAASVAGAAADLRARWGFWLSNYACFLLPSLGLPLLAQLWFPWLGHELRLGLGRVLAHQAVVFVACGLQVAWWALVLTHASVPNRPTKEPEPEIQ